MIMCTDKIKLETTIDSDELYTKIGKLPEHTALSKRDLIALFDKIFIEKMSADERKNEDLTALLN